MNKLGEPRRKKLHRIEDPESVRFITFSCDQSRHYMQDPETRDRFVERLRFVHEVLQFSLFDWVVMTNHVHLLLRPTTEERTVPKILERLKTQFARQELPLLIASGTDAVRFWLPGGGYDRNIYSAHEYREKVEYIVGNPVKAGLVDRPENWKWSSAGWPDRFWDDT